MKDTVKLKVLSVFFGGGLVAGIAFGFITGTDTLSREWFTKIEYWLIPRWPYWILAGMALLFGLAGSYLLAMAMGWIDRARSVLRILLASALITMSVPASVWLITQLTPPMGLGAILMTPSLIALLVSLAMWVVSQKWYNAIVALMVLAGILTIPLANVFFLFSSSSNEAFNATKFAVGYALVSALCGYWLIKARSDGYS